MQETSETQVKSVGREDPLEDEMATCSSVVLAWQIPWTEEPGRLQSMGSQSQTWLKWLSMHARTHAYWLLLHTIRYNVGSVVCCSLAEFLKSPVKEYFWAQQRGKLELVGSNWCLLLPTLWLRVGRPFHSTPHYLRKWFWTCPDLVHISHLLLQGPLVQGHIKSVGPKLPAWSAERWHDPGRQHHHVSLPSFWLIVSHTSGKC